MGVSVQGAGVGRKLTAKDAQKIGHGLAARLPREVPKADVDGAVAHVIVLTHRILQPVVYSLAGERIAAKQEGSQGARLTQRHEGAAELHHVFAARPVVGANGDSIPRYRHLGAGFIGEIEPPGIAANILCNILKFLNFDSIDATHWRLPRGFSDQTMFSRSSLANVSKFISSQSARIEPLERSMPPETITSVRPTAMRPTIVRYRMTLKILSCIKKCDDIAVKTMIRITNPVKEACCKKNRPTFLAIESSRVIE